MNVGEMKKKKGKLTAKSELKKNKNLEMLESRNQRGGLELNKLKVLKLHTK